MYLIIGGNGYLGNYIIQSILQNTEEQIIATARKIDNLKNTNRIFGTNVIFWTMLILKLW